VILKIVPKAACDPENCSSAMNVHWRKSTNESEGKPEQKFDVAFGTVLKKVFPLFREASKKLIFNFLLNKAGKKM
jgi:hypothetical protein